MHVYVGQRCDLHQPQYLPTLATTSANTGTCIGHTPVYVGHNTCLRRPELWSVSTTHLFTSANTGTCIGHITCIYICRPQYLFTSARAVTCIGHNMCLRRPQHLFTSANTGTCVGHIIVSATGQWHSQIPGVPGIRPARHSVMALCGKWMN